MLMYEVLSGAVPFSGLADPVVVRHLTKSLPFKPDSDEEDMPVQEQRRRWKKKRDRTAISRRPDLSLIPESCPPELARDLSPALQELAGYAMGQYALGYYTPPGGPGEAPEVVPPQYALGLRQDLSTMGGTGDLEALQKALKT